MVELSRNLKKIRDRERKKKARKAGIPVSAYSSKGKGKHSQARLSERLPIEAFSFSPKILTKMIKQGKAWVGKNREGKKRICFSIIRELSGKKWEREYKIGVNMRKRKVIGIVTVMFRDTQIVETEIGNFSSGIFSPKLGDLMETTL